MPLTVAQARRLAKLGLHPIILHGFDEGGQCTCGNPDHRLRRDGDDDATIKKLKHAGKHPRNGGWADEAFDMARLEAQLLEHPESNLGLRMGLQPDGTYRIALDVDDVEAAQRVESELGAMPETLWTRSSRGFHLIFEVTGDSFAKLSNFIARDGIDLICGRKQVVVGPSMHPFGSAYQTTINPVAALPAPWLGRLATKPAAKASEAPAALGDLTRDDRWLEHARKALKSVEPSVEGQHGGRHLFGVQCMLQRGCLLPRETSDALLLEDGGWNDQCDPPWDLGDKAHRDHWERASKRASDPNVESDIRWGSSRPQLVDASGVRHAEHPDELAANDTSPAPSEPEQSATTPAGLWQWVEADALAAALDPVDYQCEFLGFVQGDPRPDMIVGPAGYGKTGLAQAYALAVASGKPLFGAHPVASGAVYHIDNEQGRPATQRRYQLLARGAGIALAELRGKLRVFSDGVRLTRGDAINEQAVEALRRNTDGAALVIIDSLVTLGLGIDENAVAFGEVLMRLRDITRRGGPKFLVIHHSGKGESSADGRGTTAIDGERGSTWVGNASFRWKHKKKSLSDTGGFRTAFVTEWEETALTFAEARAGKQPSAKIVLADGSGGAASGVPSAAEKRMVAELVKDHPDGISRAAVETALDGGIPQKRLRGVIDTLLSDQVLVPHGTGRMSRLVPGPKITEVA